MRNINNVGVQLEKLVPLTTIISLLSTFIEITCAMMIYAVDLM